MPCLDEVPVFIVNILPVPAVTGLTVIEEQGLQLVDVIGGQGKVVALTELPLGGQSGHLFPVIAVKTVPTDHGRLQLLAGKHATENTPCSGRAGAAGAGNRNNRMAL